jgi:uncharacterized membrane protein
MGRIRHNWFVGIRTPWTMKSEVVWQKTHRLAGKLYFYGSLIAAVVYIFIKDEIVYTLAFLVFVTPITIIPVIYSYVIYKRLPIEKKELNS